MPELPDLLARAATAAAALRQSEDELEQARAAFRQLLRDAYRGGASYSLIGRVVGLSRQRVAQLVREE